MTSYEFTDESGVTLVQMRQALVEAGHDVMDVAFMQVEEIEYFYEQMQG